MSLDWVGHGIAVQPWAAVLQLSEGAGNRADGEIEVQSLWRDVGTGQLCRLSDTYRPKGPELAVVSTYWN